ncbi:arsenate reductase (glutaredoxin) [Neiella marina]|uniref:Arsenate reductase n=1 Tax=Neiella holothuriorum TaxID=2870530 RepID=A0ABS7EJ06_9GAMM|nr:arsenate reductase (glutaredoxin) [Neiella holothuriorum]MBW8192200.1 arsenate reductase (glutaredoxin) [Neiella holothuriorum]
MNSFRIYHNPRCSKSRQTLALLNENGIEPEVVEYLKTPITPGEVASLLELLHLSPRQIMRTKEAEYKEQGLADSELSDAALINAIAKSPKLLERPIVVKGELAVIGRPPENVLTLLD